MIDRISTQDFDGSKISSLADAGQRERLIDDLRVMNLCVINAIIQRFENGNAGNKPYPFIDTKINIITGEDFAPKDPLAGRDKIFGWIQGRGLEAMVGHLEWINSAQWLTPELREDLSGRLHDMIVKLTGGLQTLRLANNGRLGFVLTPDGKALLPNGSGKLTRSKIAANTPASFADIFGCKALAVAAKYLDDKALAAEAADWFGKVNADIRSGNFRSDQLSLDPNNPAAKPVEGRYTHGPRMIFIGATAVFMQATSQQKYLDFALEHIDYIIRHYTNSGSDKPGLETFDMFEFTGPDGKPYIEDGGVIRCDAGHSCEFVGLSLKVILLAKKLWPEMYQQRHETINTLTDKLGGILLQNFASGFNPAAGGMCKGFDLASRKPVNPQMPWWALSETFRAAVEAASLLPQQKEKLEAVAVQCANAFFTKFVNRNCHLMAYQTLDETGSPVAVIPATPDADPGYHTGLSIIDALRILG